MNQDFLIEVCRHCYSTNLSDADHGLADVHGDDVCVWLGCRHVVFRYESQCGACHPEVVAPW